MNKQNINIQNVTSSSVKYILRILALLAVWILLTDMYLFGIYQPYYCLSVYVIFIVALTECL